MKKLFILFSFFLIQFSLFVSEVMAQTPPPGGSNNAGAPLDGFTTLLLAAGVGYGVKRMRDSKPQ